MKLQTVRFGEIAVDEARIINFKAGILGFERLHKYIVLLQDKENPFGWLQSIEDGAVAFVVIDARLAKPDYRPVISKPDLAFLEIETEDQMCLLSIVTIRHNPFQVTANLRAPLVINATNYLGAQIVLADDTYPIRYGISKMESVSSDELAKVAV